MWANCCPLLSLSLHDMWKVLLGRYLNLYKCSGYLANVPLSQKCDGLSEWGQKLCHTTLPLMSFQPTPPQPPTLHLSWYSHIISTTIQATRMVSVGWMSSTVNHFQSIRRLSHRSKRKHSWKTPLRETLLLKLPLTACKWQLPDQWPSQPGLVGFAVEKKRGNWPLVTCDHPPTSVTAGQENAPIWARFCRDPNFLPK